MPLACGIERQLKGGGGTPSPPISYFRIAGVDQPIGKDKVGSKPITSKTQVGHIGALQEISWFDGG